MLNDEKKILEEELGKFQNSFSNDSSQLTLLSQEIETQKEKNDSLISENHELKTKVKMLELDYASLKSKLDNITKNVSTLTKAEKIYRILLRILSLHLTKED